jgi:magnesium chelatase family protein
MPARELSEAAGGETSAAIRDRVVRARGRQLARGATLNAALSGGRLRAVTRLDPGARRILETALTKLSLTARGHDRVLRVARTIADLEASDDIRAAHLAEALQFRGEG